MEDVISPFPASICFRFESVNKLWRRIIRPAVLAFRIADSCAFHWFRMPPVLMSIVASIPFSFPKNMRLCVQKKESNQYSSREGGRGKGEGEGEGQGERERRKVEGSRK